jgi:hypothetical protein
MSGLKCLGAAMALAALLSNGPAHAQQRCTDRAGWISLVDGPQSGLKITRPGAGEDLLGEPLFPLCGGDKIQAEGNTVAVIRINGEKDPVTVDARSGPYQVPPRSGANIIVHNLLDYLYEQLLPDIQRATAHARLRGTQPPDDPSFAQGALRFLSPGLTNGNARVSMADRRTGLVLRWAGGTSPYILTVADPNGRLAFETPTQSGRYANAPRLALSPGKWSLQLRDSTGAALYGSFTIVSDAAPLPPDWDPTGADESLRVLWLARCRGDVWGFDALQRVGAHRAGNVANSVAFDALAQMATSPPAACPDRM